MSEDRLSEADRWLAAEQALGLSEGDARAEAERRAARDPAFRRAVEGWHAALEPLLAEVGPVEPSEAVWRAVERRIEVQREDEPRGAVARIGPWRALALLGMGAALGAGLVAAVLGGAPAPGTTGLVATLLPSGDAPAAVARLDSEGGELVVRLSLPPEADRVPQLWLIPGDGVPRSLGTLEDGTGELRVPLGALDGVVPAPGDSLAVSLEPPGGSPTGAPTGPIVASGALVEL